MSAGSSVRPWPALPYAEWRETLETLHMWTQIVGKVRLARAAPVNHWWHIAFPVTARGLTTRATPADGRTFQIDFDFLDHVLRITTSDGGEERLALEPRSVADFHGALMAALDRLGLGIRIWPHPVEVEDPIPFPDDDTHASYDADQATRFFHAMSRANAVLERFRGEFRGKSSPAHFFWGSFDLAVSRFSGRTAPEHPGGFPNLPDRVTREAYSHEVFSAGWWPGGAAYPAPAFYAYAYPTPEGLGAAPVTPSDATWVAELGEFVLPYEAVRTAPDPEGVLLGFLRSAFAAASELAAWDRA